MKPYFVIFIFFIACLTSCNVVQYVAVPVNYGPKIFFHADTTHVLVINRFNFDTTKITNKRKLRTLKSGAYSAVKTAANQLGYLKGVRVTNLVDSVNFIADTDSVKQLAAQYKANYILSLDHFEAGIVQSDYDYSSRTVYYNTQVKETFTLYESNGIYFKKLKGDADEPLSDEEYSGFLTSLLTRPSIKQNSPSINTAAGNAALDALKDYLPYIITNNRPLYTDNDALKGAAVQILAGRFDMAFKVLNPLIDGADAKLASHAAYNLAVVYEAQGDIDEAEDLAKLSNQKQENEYAKTLIAELIKE